MRAQAPVTFEDVAVYFSPEEWAELVDWQRDLYRDVMMENHELIASLGPRLKPSVKRAKREKAPRAWDHQYSRMTDLMPPGQGNSPHGEAPVTFEDVAVYLTTEEWKELVDWQRELYQDVMKENYELATSVEAVLEKPEIVARLERGEEPYVADLLDSRKGRRAGSPSTGGDKDEGRREEEETVGLEPSKMHAWQDPERAARMGVGVSHSQCRGHRALGSPMGKGPEGALPGHRSIGAWPPSTEHQGTGTPGTLHPAPKSNGGCTGTETLALSPAAVGPCTVPRHQCRECGQGLESWAQLAEHRRLHAGAGGLACGDCGKAFSSKGNLARHRQLHTGEKRHGCRECGRRFRTRQACLSHQRVHSGEKPFTCPDCAKSFARKENLVRHRSTHTPRPPHACPDCGKSYVHEGNLVRHRDTHVPASPDAGHGRGHADTGVALPCACTHCSTGFAWKAELTAPLSGPAGEPPIASRDSLANPARYWQMHVADTIHGATFSEFLQIHEMLISRSGTCMPLGALTKYK
ncbi:hypothetical protein Y1Q_0017051 [Alligator mississippiensis]|uniref:Uncharacterized protein n=1 Tax=Alligator mississippiensis TaxID=8496 RepID=A0A151NU36_ALLMI|nr:hypothetical protein Y1Q_0017051 [Alligator mississippiensis]